MKYIVAVLILFGVSYGASRWYFSKNAATIPTILPSGQMVASSSANAVVRVSGASQRALYRINGIFSTRFSAQSDELIGQFIIDGDPQKTPISVSLRVTTGTVNLIQFPNSLDDEGDPQAVSSATVLEKISKGTRAAFFFNLGNEPSEKLVRQAFDSAIEGNWDMLARITLSPATIGIVIKK